LSTDDIVFEDLSYREPQRLRRPDRDRRWACLAYEVPGPDDLPIFLDRKPADAIERHALSDTSVELGGILLGKECVDDQTGQPFVWVTESLEAKHYENTQASFTYTHDSWEEITRERDRQFPDLDIVGWYHTHPDFGIFLSSHDLFIHHNFFAQPLQVAYVVDPIRQTRGFFQWRDGRMDQVGGYYLSAERGDRAALARLVNDLENIPNSGGGGSGLSPRLEAELIAMLTRQHQPVAVAATGQTAALFTALGIAFGVLIAFGWVWLQATNQAIRDQATAMDKLVKAIDVKAKDSQLDADRERVRAKEAALDALLREVRPGASPESFTTAFTRTRQELDEARRGLAQQEAIHKRVGSDLLDLEARNTSLRTDLASEKKKHEEYEGKVKKELDKHEQELVKKDNEISAKDKLLEETNAGTLNRKYHYAWYAAVVGWVVSVLLALGLVAVSGRVPSTPEVPPGEAPPREEPPHSIT
jgi:proteasome lid subunit RPN8/RPN11